MEIVENTTVENETVQDNALDRNEAIVIKPEDTVKVDSLLNQIETFLENNKEAGKNDDDAKTKLYGEVKGLWQDLSNHINNIGFLFNISAEEYRTLKNYITVKCEYDHQSVFMGVQIKLDFLKRADNSLSLQEPILVTCSESILIHHLLVNGGLKIKGLGEKAYFYRNIMTAIGDINKIYETLDIASKRAGQEMNDWVQGLETEETKESKKTNEEEA